jgi:RNA polymerase sigma factor (sigma-70 family)
MRDDPSVTALVTRARNGDKLAWDEIVDRYAPLVWSICRRYRLSSLDTDDVGQSVWLRLVEQLNALRDPAALPGWLATTTRRECIRVLRAANKQGARSSNPPDLDTIPDEYAAAAEQELLTAERDVALREAFGALPPRCQRLISMLIADPPVPYAEISSTLGIPIGSIGPNRRRCLNRLRRHPPLAALISAESHTTRGGDRHGQPVVDR